MSGDERDESADIDAAAWATDYPAVGPLLMLDAAIALAAKLLRQQHDELDDPEGPKVGNDDPPLPWLAGPILDQMEALRRSIDRYLRAVAQGGNCCRLCPGAGRTRSLTQNGAAQRATR